MIFDTVSFKCVAEVEAIFIVIGSMFTKKSLYWMQNHVEKKQNMQNVLLRKANPVTYFCYILWVQVLTDIALCTILKNSRNIYSNHSINLLYIISAVFGKFILLNCQSHDS